MIANHASVICTSHPLLLQSTASIAAGVLARAEKRTTAKSSRGTGLPPAKAVAKPARVSRAFAYVLQKQGISVLELIRRVRISTLPSTMLVL
jgi:hypothetical protein